MANDWQLLSLFLVTGLGFFFGLFFDILRVLREMFRFSVVAVFVQDVLFCVVSALTLFFFLLPVTGGVVRGYLIVGVLVGAASYFSTVGRAFLRVGRLGRKCICSLADHIRRLSSCIKEKTRPIFVLPFACGRFCSKKVKNFAKKVLHIGG